MCLGCCNLSVVHRLCMVTQAILREWTWRSPELSSELVNFGRRKYAATRFWKVLESKQHLDAIKWREKRERKNTILFVYILYWTDLTTSPILRSCSKIISFLKVGSFFWLRVLSCGHKLVYCWYTYYSFCIRTILNGFDHKSNLTVMF